MLNFDSLITAVTKTIAYIRMTDFRQKESPVIGFIKSAPAYLSAEVFSAETSMENAYKKILPKLRELIAQIPDGFEGVDAIAQTHITSGVAVVKGFSIDGFPFALMASPYSQKGSKIIVRLVIVVAYAKVELASDKFQPAELSPIVAEKEQEVELVFNENDLPTLPKEDPEPPPIKKPRKKRTPKAKAK